MQYLRDTGKVQSISTIAAAVCIALLARAMTTFVDNFCGLAHLEAFAFQHGGYLWAEGQTWQYHCAIFIHRMHRVGEGDINRIHPDP